MPEGSPLQTATCFLLDQNFKPRCQRHRLIAKFHVAEEERELEQSEPCVPFQTTVNSSKHRKAKGKTVAAGKAARQNNATCFVFFISSHIFSLFIFTPYGVCRMLGEVGGWVQEKEGVGEG